MCLHVFVVTGSRVVVRCLAPKLTEVALPFHFQPNRWYHVVITHTTGSALSSSFIRMFVDGNLEASSRFKYVKVLAPPHDCGSIACATAGDAWVIWSVFCSSDIAAPYAFP